MVACVGIGSYNLGTVKLLIIITFLTLCPTPALAAPKLLVRARTVIRDVEKVQRSDGSTVIKGRLLDQDFRHGIPRRRIEATVIRKGVEDTLVTRTDRLGNFAILLPRAKGVYKVSFRFGGDQIYARKTTPPWEFDVTKLDLDLDLAVASALDASNPTQSITATARSGGVAVSVPLILSTGRGEILARFSTSRMTGKATPSFPTKKLGQPGPINLIATFRGNSEINRVSLRYETILETPVYLSLEADEKEVSAEEEVKLSGRARDPTGPVPGATITIHADGTPAGSAVTGSDGRFSVSLPSSSYPPGELDLTARYSPNVIWRRAASSSLLEITILAPRPIPVRLYAVPAVLTVVLLICLVIVRFRRELMSVVRRRTVRIKKHPIAPQPVASGVRLSRRTIRSLITQSATISGEVWDATDTRLVLGAAVEVRDPSGQVIERGKTDGVGKFSTGDLPAGMLQVTVSMAGYVSETFRCQVPHRGTLNGLRVDLVQVRVRVLEMYRDAALPLLPREEYWGHWTPRELVHHLSRRAGRRHKVLELLTRLLEEAYWGKEPAHEAVVERARDLAQALERGGTVRY